MSAEKEAIASAHAGEQALSGLVMTAETRHRELKTRLIIAAIGAGILAAVVDPAVAGVWIAVVCASQALDAVLWAPFRKADRQEPPSRAEWLRVCFASA
ncbi:MAG: hypothetical protein AAGJ87_10090, partial [Pseudomonadota bacterium]